MAAASALWPAWSSSMAGSGATTLLSASTAIAEPQEISLNSDSESESDSSSPSALVAPARAARKAVALVPEASPLRTSLLPPMASPSESAFSDKTVFNHEGALPSFAVSSVLIGAVCVVLAGANDAQMVLSGDVSLQSRSLALLGTGFGLVPTPIASSSGPGRFDGREVGLFTKATPALTSSSIK